VAEAAAVNVRVDVPDPGAAKDDGLNAAVTPVGNPEIDSETGAEKPLLTLEVTLIDALLAC
jgi:hypothetical protein